VNITLKVVPDLVTSAYTVCPAAVITSHLTSKATAPAKELVTV